jgi:ketosteroid isomerase-like protein
MVPNEEQINESLEHYGEALSAGDLAGISSCWEIPGLVLSDEGAVVVSDKGQIEGFFAQAIESYRSQGLVTTRPELERAEALSARLTSVEVRWASLDEAGVERSSERSHYILRRGDDGRHRIQVALTRPPSS